MPLLIEAGRLRPASAGAGARRDYRPLGDVPTLFVEFADTPGTFSDLAAFANRFGSLGGDAEVEFSMRTVEGGTARLRGEPFFWWLDFAAEVRLAIELWAASKRRTSRGFGGRVERTDDGDVFLAIPPPSGHDQDLGARSAVASVPMDKLHGLAQAGRNAEIAAFWKDQLACDASVWNDLGGKNLVSSKQFHPERAQAVKGASPSALASFAFADLINAGLEGRVSPLVDWSRDDRAHHLRLAPNSLLGAIWLQFAMAADENRSYERCSSCDGWFEISPGHGRPDKTYCSNACRMRAYRKRKSRAIEET